MIADEIVAYHLSTLLGLDNVPITRLLEYNESNPQWQGVVPNLRQANWTDGMLVPVMEFIHNIQGKRCMEMFVFFRKYDIMVVLQS